MGELNLKTKTSKTSTLAQVSSLWQMQDPTLMALNSSCALAQLPILMESIAFLDKLDKTASPFFKLSWMSVQTQARPRSHASSSTAVKCEEVIVKKIPLI